MDPEKLSALPVRAPQRTPYEEHRDYVLNVLGRRCSWLDPSDREALLHDAYTVFLEKQHDGELDVDRMHGSQVRAYLTQTALNKAMDEGKRAGRRRSVSLDDEDLRIDPADHRSEPVDQVAAKFDDARVREIVAELPERRQLVIKLRFFFNRTPQEIQRYMGITERVYRRELERATRQLAERFEMLRQGTFCESRRSLILAYVTGVAGPNRMQEARRHLDTCPGCAAWATELLAAVKRAAAVVPPPLLTLGLGHSHMASIVAAAHGAHARGTGLAASLRDHAMRSIVRGDSSPLAALSNARPSTVALLVSGCLAGGSTVTYCLEQGVPAPLRSVIGMRIGGSTPHRHRHRQTVKLAASRSPAHGVTRQGAAPPPILAPAPSHSTAAAPAPRARPASVTVRRAARARTARARTQQPSTPVALTASTTSTPPSAAAVHRATAPEFGVGNGSPVPSSPSSRAPASSPSPSSSSSSPSSSSSTSSGANHGSPPPPKPSKPLPEFDP